MTDHAIASDPARWRQIALITLGAAALYVGFRYVPTGTDLNHMDFRVTGGNVLEFCDPSNPQFIPVVAVRSPVSMTLRPAQAPQPGEPVELTVSLRTAGGKPIGPRDLVVAHTRKLHLLIVDPWLKDYQHVHPEPGERDGDWVFAFTPHGRGTYRIFADFVPVATGRGLYASADLPVGPDRTSTVSLVMQHETSWTTVREGYRFDLAADAAPVRAGRPATLSFAITRPGGGPVPLEPVMDAFAHLVAFDEERSGFAHLHPNEVDLAWRPDPEKPVLTFQVTFPQPGRYVIWSQVNLGGREVFAPFAFEVEE
ncbi:MAG: hypothetical protein KIT44_15170 [Opitutaceae bacterium]|nr:hypothetical protein [Opitutaceae bacterium]